METRIAVIGIIVENKDSVESVNELLHQYSQYIIGRMGLPYAKKKVNIISVVVEAPQDIISALSGKGMTVTGILLNDWNPNTPDLIYPGTQKNSNAFYYMFNAQTENGVEQTKAIASFLADHYSGKNPNYGKVSNWIIGNEINNQQWNYMGPTDLTAYVRAYQKAFRVIYTAIKSTNANDRVYFSLDYNWMNEIDGKLKYGGKFQLHCQHRGTDGVGAGISSVSMPHDGAGILG